jgi:hypothetical protein
LPDNHFDHAQQFVQGVEFVLVTETPQDRFEQAAGVDSLTVNNGDRALVFLLFSEVTDDGCFAGKVRSLEESETRIVLVYATEKLKGFFLSGIAEKGHWPSS